MLSTHARVLRVIHGLFAAYFGLCIIYMYYAATVQRFDFLLGFCMASLLVEGVALLLNNGNCPLIHIQRRVGDDKPFFEIFLPTRPAQLVIPVVAVIALAGAGYTAVRYATSGQLF